MKPKHTPSPWYLGGDNINGTGILGREHGFYVCLIPDDSEPEQIANARLIAAAPDLLAALQDELAALDTWSRDVRIPSDVADGIEISRDKIARAIAKATQP